MTSNSNPEKVSCASDFNYFCLEMLQEVHSQCQPLQFLKIQHWISVIFACTQIFYAHRPAFDVRLSRDSLLPEYRGAPCFGGVAEDRISKTAFPVP